MVTGLVYPPLILAIKADLEPQSEPFIYHSKYTEAQLATPTSFLLSAIAAEDFEERFVYQKYSSKKFLKASIFARQWAIKTLESATKAQEMLMK